MAKKKVCGLCNEGTWKRSELHYTRTVADVEFTATLPCETCTHCKESAIAVQTLEAWELAVAQQLGDLKIRTGDAFRFMRKSLGLSGVALANLLGVASETVSRWENVAPDSHAFVLLTSMVSDRIAGTSATLDRLRAPDARSVLEPVQVTLPRLKAS